MRKIVMANQKGGVGKSTLGAHLAVEAEAQGAGPVALIDIDPQGTMADWWNARLAPTPLFAAVDISQLATQLAALEKAGVALVIIDTPGSVHPSVRQAIEQADLVIMPTRPSPLDLRAIGPTIELVEAAAKKMLFVINGAKARARLTSQAAIALSQHGTVAPVIVSDRTDYAAAMTDGRTLPEVEAKGPGATEINELWKYVHTQLKK
jgi:chromosome partitioning protein